MMGSGLVWVPNKTRFQKDTNLVTTCAAPAPADFNRIKFSQTKTTGGNCLAEPFVLQQYFCPSVGLPEKSSNAVGGCPFRPYLGRVALIWALFGLIWGLFWPYFRNLQMPLGVALIWALFGPYLGLILALFQTLLGVALISALFGPYFGLTLDLFQFSYLSLVLARLQMLKSGGLLVCFLFDFRQGLALPLT